MHQRPAVIRWRGEAVDPTTGHLPIAFIHQDLGLVDSMTVAENIALLTGYPRKRGIIDWRGATAAAVAALRTMESSINAECASRHTVGGGKIDRSDRSSACLSQ